MVSRRQNAGKSPDQLRQERARQQFAQYRFRLLTVQTSAGPRTLVAVEGGTQPYTVNDLERCCCVDFRRRQKPCKHVLMVRMWLSGETPGLPVPPFDVEAEARTQQALRDRELLWG